MHMQEVLFIMKSLKVSTSYRNLFEKIKGNIETYFRDHKRAAIREKYLDSIKVKYANESLQYTVHMMPVSKNNNNEGWIKTYQTFHNNSVEWWVNKFEKKFSKVQVINSSWKDHISIGKWFICYK